MVKQNKVHWSNLDVIKASRTALDIIVGHRHVDNLVFLVLIHKIHDKGELVRRVQIITHYRVFDPRRVESSFRTFVTGGVETLRFASI
jgi:hypothetical protein